MFVEKVCKHFVHQEDRNGEMAISFCNAMKDPYQNHEGNDRCYPCPLGLDKKRCYKLILMGSDKPQITTNADRIRGMSDEELHKFLLDFEAGDIDYAKTFCDLCCKDAALERKSTDCEGCLLWWLKNDATLPQGINWLQQPAKEERYEDD